MPLDGTYSSASNEVDETTALLIRARSFLERGWCKWAQAQDTAGEVVDPKSENAVAWCAVGAIRAACLPHQRHCAFHRLQSAISGDNRGQRYQQVIERFNDASLGVQPILAAFDRAIAAGHTGREG